MELLVGLLVVIAVVAVVMLGVSLLVVRGRYGSFRNFLSDPSKIVDSLLVHQKVGSRIEQVEYVILQDGPSIKAFVLEHPGTIAALAAFVGWVLLVGAMGIELLTVLLLWLWAVFTLRLVVAGLRNYYTRYVMTNFRVIRVEGILHRENFSIPWGRITDFSWDQNYVGRLLGYATIRIETASEESGLRELKNLRDPEGFNAVFVRLVEQRQGLISLDEREDIGWLQDVNHSEEWRELKAKQDARQIWTHRLPNPQHHGPDRRPPRPRRPGL